jgi:hypothetical protein
MRGKRPESRLIFYTNGECGLLRKDLPQGPGREYLMEFEAVYAVAIMLCVVVFGIA